MTHADCNIPRTQCHIYSSKKGLVQHGWFGWIWCNSDEAPSAFAERGQDLMVGDIMIAPLCC